MCCASGKVIHVQCSCHTCRTDAIRRAMLYCQIAGCTELYACSFLFEQTVASTLFCKLTIIITASAFFQGISRAEECRVVGRLLLEVNLQVVFGVTPDYILLRFLHIARIERWP